MSSPPQQYDVMVSYRVKETGAPDKGGDGFAHLLGQCLQQLGFRVFVDVQTLKGGDFFDQVIQDAILNSKALVAVCSPTYADDREGFTFMEFSLAKSKGKKILPVWHSGEWPPHSLSLYLSSVNYIPKGSVCVQASPAYVEEPKVYVQAVAEELQQALDKLGVKPSNAPSSSSGSKGQGQLVAGVQNMAVSADVSWDQLVNMSAAAKKVLKDAGILPSVAKKLMDGLGYSEAEDLKDLTIDMVSELDLPPLQLNKLKKLLTPAATPPQKPVPAAAAPPPQRPVPVASPPRQKPVPAAAPPPQKPVPAAAPPPQKPVPAAAKPPQKPVPAAATPPQKPVPAAPVATKELPVSTPDNKQWSIISGSGDCIVRVWDPASGQCKVILEGHRGTVRSVAVTPDGSTIISGSGDNTVRVWDLGSGQCKAILEGHTDHVYGVAVTPDGSTIISGGIDNTVRVWDMGSGQCKATLEGHGNQVNSVAVTPDGSTIISGSSDWTARVWDLRSGQCKATLEGHTGGVCVAVTPDGSTIISGSGDGTVRVWDLGSGQCKATLKGHARGVGSVAVTPDGSTIISGSGDKTVRVWDMGSGQCKATLEGHTKDVNSVAVTPDGSAIISGSGDKTVRVWDLESGQCKATLGHTWSVYGVAVI